MAELRLVANNSERDLMEYRIGKELIVLECLRPHCRYRWKATIADCDEPKCPRCHSEF
jgi:hypothetical protein